MSYTPGKVIGKNFETEEEELKPQLVQINLDLIAGETKRLQEQIDKLNKANTKLKKKTNDTHLSSAFLLG